MPLDAGTTVGRYEVRSFIGAGGMGEVYLAQDTQLQRPVALKVLTGAPAADEERLRRFALEARATSALNHPNILTIYEVGATDSLHFISAEYVAGLTLRRLMSNAPLAPTAAFDITIQLAAALAAAHAVGIVHRDIKPENVMLRTDGYVKVLDFGLAKLTESFGARPAGGPDATTHRDVITNPGVVMGTVYYMSPEQARGLDVDARTDIWSLGVVLYELLTGQVPFPGETGSDVIAAVLEKPPPRLGRYLPHAPPELQRIVNKMLAKNREERYQSVKDLLIDVKALKRELELNSEQEDYVATASDHTTPPGGGDKKDPPPLDGEKAADTGDHRRVSSAEYLITEIKKHRKAATLLLALLALALAFAVYAGLPLRTPADSVAILPFVNGVGPELETFGDGLTDSVINNLTTAGVKVKSRHAAFSYKGKGMDPQKIGRELGVRAVLTGSIQKQGDALVIKAALVNVADDFQLWGKQYPVYDLVGGGRFLALQEDISKQITDELKTKIINEGKKP